MNVQVSPKQGPRGFFSLLDVYLVDLGLLCFPASRASESSRRSLRQPLLRLASRLGQGPVLVASQVRQRMASTPKPNNCWASGIKTSRPRSPVAALKFVVAQRLLTRTSVISQRHVPMRTATPAVSLGRLFYRTYLHTQHS